MAGPYTQEELQRMFLGQRGNQQTSWGSRPTPVLPPAARFGPQAPAVQRALPTQRPQRTFLGRPIPQAVRGHHANLAEQFARDTRPQSANETNAAYALRSTVMAPARFIGGVNNAIGAPFTWGTDTPAQVEQRARAAQQQAMQTPAGGGDLLTAFGLPQQPTAAGSQGFNVQGFFTALEGSGPNAVSPKGARGTMQVMPTTAPDAARMAGLPYDANLFNASTPQGDAYRSALGTAYGAAQFAKYGDPVLAAAAYNAGPGRVDQWLQRFGDPRTGQVSMTQFINSIPFGETRNYATRAFQLTGPQGANGLPLAPLGFDPTRFLAAGTNNLAAARMAEQPMEASFNPGPMPALPAPQELKPTDFTKVDEALEATRPEELDEKKKLRMQRRGWMQGIAQALASFDFSATGGEGVGGLLAKVGAGALMGRGVADDEIQRREDLHDEQLRQFNLLIASNERAKAQDLATTMRYNSEQAYAHSLKKFDLSFNEWQKKANPVIQGGRIITTQIGPDGTYKVRSAPIDRSAMAAAMMANSQIMMAIGTGENQVSQANWQFNAAHLFSQAANSSEPQDMMTAVAVRVGEALNSGVISQYVSPDEMQELTEAANQAAQQVYPLTLTGQDVEQKRAAMVQTQLIAGLTARAAQDPGLRNILFSSVGQIGQAAGQATRYMDRRQTQSTSVNARGQTSTSTRVTQQ